MPNCNAEPRLTSAHNVVAIRPMGAADRLEALARKPLQPRRDLLRQLADRQRALDALADERQVALEDDAA
jgi:hypothetical protein